MTNAYNDEADDKQNKTIIIWVYRDTHYLATVWSWEVHRTHFQHQMQKITYLLSNKHKNVYRNSLSMRQTRNSNSNLRFVTDLVLWLSRLLNHLKFTYVRTSYTWQAFFIHISQMCSKHNLLCLQNRTAWIHICNALWRCSVTQVQWMNRWQQQQST